MGPTFLWDRHEMGQVFQRLACPNDPSCFPWASQPGCRSASPTPGGAIPVVLPLISRDCLKSLSENEFSSLLMRDSHTSTLYSNEKRDSRHKTQAQKNNGDDPIATEFGQVLPASRRRRSSLPLTEDAGPPCLLGERELEVQRGGGIAQAPPDRTRTLSWK